MRQVCEEFEAEQSSDAAEVKQARFERVLSLMQKVGTLRISWRGRSPRTLRGEVCRGLEARIEQAPGYVQCLPAGCNFKLDQDNFFCCSDKAFFFFFPGIHVDFFCITVLLPCRHQLLLLRFLLQLLQIITVQMCSAVACNLKHCYSGTLIVQLSWDHAKTLYNLSII